MQIKIYGLIDKILENSFKIKDAKKKNEYYK